MLIHEKNNCVFFLFVCFISHSNETNDINKISKIENLIIKNKKDSATILLSEIKSSEYKKLLNKIVSNNSLTLKDYYLFFSTIYNNKNIDCLELSNYINKNVGIPLNKNKISVDYVFIKHEQIMYLSNSEYLDNANQEMLKLRKYINSFDIRNTKVQLLSAYSKTYDIILSLIQSDYHKGINLIEENLKLAKKHNDKKLEALSYFLMSDFAMSENNHNKYILLCEKSYELEKTFERKSNFYFANIIHLIDALIYKGGENKKALILLDEIYNNAQIRAESYSLFAKYLSFLEKDSKEKINIFQKFKVKNTKEFCKLVRENGVRQLSSQDLYFLLIECSAALEKDDFLKEAIRYQESAVYLNRVIYGKELSNSIANYKTSIEVEQKEELKAKKIID